MNWPVKAIGAVIGTALGLVVAVAGAAAEHATAAFPGTNGTIAFTSNRDGNTEIYVMESDGSGQTRRTNNSLISDREAAWSPDGSKIAFYSDRDVSGDIWVMNADGSNKRQVTKNGKANFAPYFFPDGKRIIFASNMDDPKGRNFDIYKINVDGSGLERITDNDTFDGFPMFSPDGKKLVFASNRNAESRGETNVFIADWVE